MKSIEQKRIDRLFADLLTSEIKDKEQLDLWLVRAKDCISVELGHDSAFLPLLEPFSGSEEPTPPQSPEESTPPQISERSRRAKAVLAAAQKHAPISSAKVEEDEDLKKEAEYAIHNAAARSPWLKVAAAILVAAAGFTFTGTLKLNNFSLDLENRIQRAMDARKQALKEAGDAASKSLETEGHTKEAELKASADLLEKRLAASLGEFEKQWERRLDEAGSGQIKKISGDNAPDLLLVAKGIESRVNHAEQRQGDIEKNLHGLEGLSARLDKATISKLTVLSFERILPWAALAVSIMALLVAIFRQRRPQGSG